MKNLQTIVEECYKLQLSKSKLEAMLIVFFCFGYQEYRDDLIYTSGPEILRRSTSQVILCKSCFFAVTNTYIKIYDLMKFPDNNLLLMQPLIKACRKLLLSTYIMEQLEYLINIRGDILPLQFPNIKTNSPCYEISPGMLVMFAHNH